LKIIDDSENTNIKHIMNVRETNYFIKENQHFKNIQELEKIRKTI